MGPLFLAKGFLPCIPMCGNLVRGKILINWIQEQWSSSITVRLQEIKAFFWLLTSCRAGLWQNYMVNVWLCLNQGQLNMLNILLILCRKYINIFQRDTFFFFFHFNIFCFLECNGKLAYCYSFKDGRITVIIVNYCR